MVRVFKGDEPFVGYDKQVEITTSEKAVKLAEIEAEIKAVDVTPRLREQATHLVFGVGNPNAKIVFIGEAPGKNEDLKGEPFVGAAGKFLDEMLASISLEREDVYITNIVKYRPPANRDPESEEIAAWRPYLERQLEVIQPMLVVFLGRHAMNVFLPDMKIGEAHGKPVKIGGQMCLPLYHPAAALHNGGMRSVLKEDFLSIPTILAKAQNLNESDQKRLI